MIRLCEACLAKTKRFAQRHDDFLTLFPNTSYMDIVRRGGCGRQVIRTILLLRFCVTRLRQVGCCIERFATKISLAALPNKLQRLFLQSFRVCLINLTPNRTGGIVNYRLSRRHL